MKKLFFIFAIIDMFEFIPRDKYKKGKTKNLKHAADDKGFPGNPKKLIFFLNLANIIGFPGRMATPLKVFFNLNFVELYAS